MPIVQHPLLQPDGFFAKVKKNLEMAQFEIRKNGSLKKTQAMAAKSAGHPWTIEDFLNEVEVNRIRMTLANARAIRLIFFFLPAGLAPVSQEPPSASRCSFLAELEPLNCQFAEPSDPVIHLLEET